MSFLLSYAPDKQTDRQTDGLEHPTHAARQSWRIGNTEYSHKIFTFCDVSCSQVTTQWTVMGSEWIV